MTRETSRRSYPYAERLGRKPQILRAHIARVFPSSHEVNRKANTMAHMNPSYYEGIYSEITNGSGESYFVPDEIRFRDASDYCEGEVKSVTVCEGVLYQLSAPGYMDQTEWAFAESIEEARAELSAQYDICADCGADMEEREGILCAECSGEKQEEE